MPASGFFLQLTDPGGETVYSSEFIADYNTASKAASQKQTTKPIVDLLKTYTKANERAELQYTLGFKMPHAKRIDAYMLRGNAYENDSQFEPALEDYLRGLLDCSEFDLSGPWPENTQAPLVWNNRSDDPAEIQKGRDYNAARERIRRTQHLMRQKYFFVDAIKRVRGKNDLKTILNRFVSGEERRINKVQGWIEAENPQPWP